MGFAMLLLALNQEAQKLMYPDCNFFFYSGGQLITCPEEPPQARVESGPALMINSREKMNPEVSVQEIETFASESGVFQLKPYIQVQHFFFDAT